MSDSEYPIDYDAERCLLSCVMRGGGDVRSRAVDRMRPVMFDKYQDLAHVVLSIARDGRPDPDTVRSEFEGQEDRVDEVLDHRPAPQHVGRFMKRVQESYGKLELIRIASEASNEAKDDHSFSEVSAKLEEEVIGLTQRVGEKDDKDESQIIQQILQEIEDTQGEVVTGVATPFPSINNLTGGFQDGELTIPFGSTSMGKTSWALTCALHAAKNGVGVAVHTLEMSKTSLYKRLMQMRAGVDPTQQTVPDEEMARLRQAGADIYDLPIYIRETSGLDYLTHRSSLRRLKYDHDIGLAVLDYLQIMQGPEGKSYSQKHHKIHDAAQGLKDTAKILEMPVIAPSQTTKAKDKKRGDKRPTLADLRQAGEEPTDVAIGLYRPEYYGIEQWADGGGSTEGEGVSIVAKQRNGPTGEVKLAFVEHQAKWQPLDKRNRDDAPF